MRGKNHNLDMTDGSIVKLLIRFTLPLLVGNLFQQLYNMVDAWVIGQTGVNEAYAAVGSVGPILNILIGFFSGLASGAGVVISQYFGAKQPYEIKRAVHTAMSMTIGLGVLFTVIGITMTPTMLRVLFRTQEGAAAIYPYAKTYIIICFSGMFSLLVYNMGAGILRAVGDSRHPFYFLLVSVFTNISLDLLFVFVFHMGVAGVALATIIAQFASAVLTVIALLRTDSPVKFSPKALCVDRHMLTLILRIGIPAALQMAVTAFSNVFVQSYIAGVNGDPTYTLGGWTTYSKVDQLIFLPVQSIALAVTTFVGQNIGTGNIRRAKRGTYTAYGLATAVNAVLITVILLFAEPLSAAFNHDPQVVAYSKLLLLNLSPFYLFTCVNQVFAAAMRGAGNARTPMIIMLSCFVGFRQVYLFVVSNYISNDLMPVAFSYPVGWMLCCTCLLLYYAKRGFSGGNKPVVQNEQGE